MTKMRDLIKLVEAEVIDFSAERAARREPTFGDMRRNIGGEVVGYQIGDEQGYSIQGEDEDPTGLASYEILAPDAAAVVRARYPTLRMAAIYADDIEEPVVLDADAVAHRLEGSPVTEDDTPMLTLDVNGDNEEEIVQSLMGCDGKLSVDWNRSKDGFDIGAPLEGDEPKAFVPMGAVVANYTLRDEEDVREWLHQSYLNVQGR